MTGTFFSLVPPIVAIALALITKEVYSSLFIGILIGGAFFAIDAGSGFTGFFTHVFSDGMIKQLSSSWNVGILVFLVVLGTMVALMKLSVNGQKSTSNQSSVHRLQLFVSACSFSSMIISTVLQSALLCARLPKNTRFPAKSSLI